MQIFIPYASPLETAKCLDPKRLNRQIQEAKVILDAINGTGKGWFNHPVVKMYAPHSLWLKFYYECLKKFSEYERYRWGIDFADAINNDLMAVKSTPPFLTEEFCDQHKRRLYTKDNKYYKKFAKYGESEENWYYVDGGLRKYINGKRIE